MRSTATTTIGTGATLTALMLFGACTTHVPLAANYRGPVALPSDVDTLESVAGDLPLAIQDESELRERARFIVHRLSVPSPSDPAQSIEFEYYDVDGDARTPVIVLLPIFTGNPAIQRFFARYFANQGWAAIVVLRTRDPLEVLVAPEATVQGNLKDYRRVLDWIEQIPDLDAARVGVFGVSLGAMDAVMLAALDKRVDALVVAMAGGDLPYLVRNTNYRRVVRSVDEIASREGTSREGLSEKLDAEIATDPLVLAPYVDAERVLMIMTRTDAIIPFEAQQRLRASLGSPEALRLVTGHRPSVLLFLKVRSVAFEFFSRRFELEHLVLASN